MASKVEVFSNFVRRTSECGRWVVEEYANRTLRFPINQSTEPTEPTEPKQEPQLCPMCHQLTQTSDCGDGYQRCNACGSN